MKSSTIRRSSLSKETLNVIENLATEENTISSDVSSYSEADNTPEEYVREEYRPNIADSKSKEIDMLWQSFKGAQISSNSTLMSFIGGIFTGIILTVLVFALFGVFSKQDLSVNDSVSQTPAEETTLLDDDSGAATDVEAIPVQTSTETSSDDIADVTSPKMIKYVIKDGDTVEGIIKKHYGSYSTERAEAIMKANNLKNLDRISIDQVLLIPMDK